LQCTQSVANRKVALVTPKAWRETSEGQAR